MMFVVRLPRALTSLRSRPFSSTRMIAPGRPTVLRTRTSSFSSTVIVGSKNKSGYFSSKAPDPQPEEQSQTQTRKTKRNPAARNPLRRALVEAQRTSYGKDTRRPPLNPTSTKVVTAICTAEEYDLDHVQSIFKGLGYEIDPYKTGLYPQLVHIAMPVQTDPIRRQESTLSTGDLFIFPSGTVVSWAIPEKQLTALVSSVLLPAAKYPLNHFEEEDFEFLGDPNCEKSYIKGDRIILATKQQSVLAKEEIIAASKTTRDSNDSQDQNANLDIALTKVAYSSGLARSTKVAVLEGLLNDYFESTKSLPLQLSKGGKLPFRRSFISQKTGQLLSIRAQLNLYSELTDSLPDMFWNSKHALNLEEYYEQVSKALDSKIRIKILNEKMDYAQEIASVLRQHLSEVHGVRLEWIIILLIAVEVIIAVRREIVEYREKNEIADEAIT